ncbi:MAG TPA: TonB C-terminal domain-containing protein, partial [Noviherbaspirillum sp.]|nr:TonB C-terminal domain-containing protein [Noviherbaspirillum sp.]
AVAAAEARDGRFPIIHHQPVRVPCCLSTELAGTTIGPQLFDFVRRSKSNIFYVVPNDTGNEAVEYEIILKRDGTILELVKRHSSGVNNWDDAVRDAIYRSEPFPSDENRMLPEGIVLHSRPKD